MDCDFRLMTKEEYLSAAEENPYNHGEFMRQLYGSHNPEYGYFGTKNSDRINDYLRGVSKGVPGHWEEQAKKTIEYLHRAVRLNELPRAVTLFRLFRLSYLKEHFALSEEMELFEQARRMKERKGTYFCEKGFSSTGIRVDQNPEIFNPGRPYLLILQVPAGTKAFVTNNVKEGEILFDTDLKILVEEVEDRLSDGINVPATDFYEIGEENTILFRGIVLYGQIAGGELK